MSEALVKKSLALIDFDFDVSKDSNTKKFKRKKNVLNLIPENHKILTKISKEGQKKQKINLLSSKQKLTVVEAKKIHKSREQRLKENLEKIKLIQEACMIKLDDQITEQIIERAVTRRPVKQKDKTKEVTQTAFTEEDFKKFEEEYFDENL